MADPSSAVTIEDVKEFLSRILMGDDDFEVSPGLVKFMPRMRAEWFDLRQFTRHVTSGTHVLINNLPASEFNDVEEVEKAVLRFKVMPTSQTFANAKATRRVAVMANGRVFVECEGVAGELRRRGVWG